MSKTWGWDDAVDTTEPEKVLLPEGVVCFFVEDWQKKKREVGERGICNIAKLNMLVQPLEDNGIEAQPLEDDLILHSDFKWKFLQFFTAIGQRKHGDNGSFVPNWDAVAGKSGRCVIKHRTFTYKKGAKEGQSGTAMEIDRFLAPGEEWKPAEKSATPTTTPTTPKKEEPEKKTPRRF